MGENQLLMEFVKDSRGMVGDFVQESAQKVVRELVAQQQAEFMDELQTTVGKVAAATRDKDSGSIGDIVFNQLADEWPQERKNLHQEWTNVCLMLICVYLRVERYERGDNEEASKDEPGEEDHEEE